MVSFAPLRCAPVWPRFFRTAAWCARVPVSHRTLMSITQDQVVTLHYTLKDDAGEIIDSSPDGEPLAYLHGHGNLVPGLERRLRAQAGHGARAVSVTQISGDMVTQDGNHPLAGKTLHFQVEVAEVRAAT